VKTKPYEDQLFCTRCSKPVRRKCFRLSRTAEFSEFNSSSDGIVMESEILTSRELSTYCSRKCLDLDLHKAMSEDGISLTQEAPGSSRVGICAVCGKKFSMRGFHTIYEVEKTQLLGDGLCDTARVKVVVASVTQRWAEYVERWRPSEPLHRAPG